MAPYIASKLNRFTSDTGLRRIIGQGKTSFKFDQIMNESKIFLVKLGKGRFGPVVSSLITNQLVSRFKLAAMKRLGFKTIKDETRSSAKRAEKIKRRSRFVYGTDAGIVDGIINRRREEWKAEFAGVPKES